MGKKTKIAFASGTLDIEAGELFLHPFGSEIKTAQRIPYEFTLKGHIVGASFPRRRWPHFRIAAVVSEDRHLTATDYLLPYDMPLSHKRILSSMFPVGTANLRLKDQCTLCIFKFIPTREDRVKCQV